MNSFLSLANLLMEDAVRFHEPSAAVLSRFFQQHRMARHQRDLLADILFTGLRHRQKINTFFGHQANAQETLLGSLYYADAVHHVLDDLSTQNQQTIADLAHWQDTFSGSLNTQSELPDWLIERLRPLDNESLIALGQSMMTQAPLDVRVNIRKAKRDVVLAQLQQEGFNAHATPISPWGIRLQDKPDLHKHPLFLDGTLEIQDEGSQLLALLTQAKKGEMVVDFCAGAGGKTLAMGAMMRDGGRLYAFDTVSARLNRLKPRLAKSGLSHVIMQTIDSLSDNKLSRLKGKCDCVLVDAPCSGSGTLRRQPDLKYRHNAETIAQLCATQAQILQAASSLVKPKGRLIYATCSLLAEENTQQINTFLQENTHFALSDCTHILPEGTIHGSADKMVYLSPIISQTDGFFAAVLSHQ